MKDYALLNQILREGLCTLFLTCYNYYTAGQFCCQFNLVPDTIRARDRTPLLPLQHTYSSALIAPLLLLPPLHPFVILQWQQQQSYSGPVCLLCFHSPRPNCISSDGFYNHHHPPAPNERTSERMSVVVWCSFPIIIAFSAGLTLTTTLNTHSLSSPPHRSAARGGVPSLSSHKVVVRSLRLKLNSPPALARLNSSNSRSRKAPVSAPLSYY